MARPRRDTETQIEDMFFDLDTATQERLLRMLEKLHRFKARQPNGTPEAKPDKPASAQQEIPMGAP